MRVALLVFLGLISAFTAVLLWNAESCKAPHSYHDAAPASQQLSPQASPETWQAKQFDQEELATQLAQAIQIATVSHDRAPTDSDAFTAFHRYLQQQFPLLHQHLQRHIINRHSLLYRWPARGDTGTGTGTDTTKPAPLLLLAHMDVVPANAEDWQHPPFAGVIDATSVWGRGALDDKSSLITLLHATETLLAEGFQPNRDIYFAFGHDEEIGGSQGAAKIAAYFKDRGVTTTGAKTAGQRFAAVLDEGGVIAKGFVPGLGRPFAAIGPSEKGYLSVKLLASGESGHSSMPAAQSAITRLNQALVNIHDNPFPADYSMIRNMMRTIAGALPFQQRLVLCNDWIFSGLITSLLEKTPALNASMRTTTAITQVSAGFKDNVIPSHAEAVVNLRLLPGVSIEDALEHLRTVINDEHIRLTVIPGAKISGNVTNVSGKAYQWVANSLRMSSNDKQLLIAPRVVTAGTDSSHFDELSDNILRFAPFTITPDTLAGIHGANEHIDKQELVKATRFYYVLLKNSNTLL